MSIRSKIIAAVATGLMMGATLTLAPAAEAHEAAPTTSGFSGTAAAHTDFTAQTKKAGLSSAQTTALQAKVDHYLAKADGRQVSANKIVMSDGAQLTVVAPGQKYARDLAAPPQTRKVTAWECDYKYFCMYRGQNGTGDRLALYNCRDYALSNWTGYGSWYNNQTPGTRAQLKGRNREVLVTTLGAPSYNPSYNWDPIWYVKPC